MLASPIKTPEDTQIYHDVSENQHRPTWQTPIGYERAETENEALKSQMADMQKENQALKHQMLQMERLMVEHSLRCPVLKEL